MSLFLFYEQSPTQLESNYQPFQSCYSLVTLLLVSFGSDHVVFTVIVNIRKGTLQLG